MYLRRKNIFKGFTLVEAVISTGIFVIFSVGIYSAMVYVSKIVYASRMVILETAVLSEELEVARNLPYDSIGIQAGVPSGVLQHTKTVTRDGAQFNIVTTVRNIDLPFDGTAGGSPNDLSPADAKLVEVSAQCVSCLQQTATILSTTVGPKGLEGSSLNGALFINVFDADGQPVPGATVRVRSVNPNVTIDDVTDNSGYLRIVDTPTGTASYAINVSKNGYSTDYTVTTTVAIPNPVKPRANVVSQQVTDISFSIDKLSNLDVHTINPACNAIGTIGFSMQGTKLLGITPNVYKFSNSYTTDGSGNKSFSSLEWDNYTINLTGNTYDIAGSIPLLPLNLVPDTNQDLQLILKAHTANSLLVQVQDAGTLLPLASTTVRLTDNASYDKTVMTGLGYMRQTNWSGGGGAATFTEGRYWSDDGNVSVTVSAGDVLLKKVGQNYQQNGQLDSGTFDFGTTVNFNNIIFTPTTQPSQVGTRSVLMQIATSNSSTPTTWSYTGPDGTASTYYSVTSTLIHANNSGKRYLRYRLFLHSDNNKYTPTFSEVAFTYTDSCTPPGQAFFDSLSATTYTLILSTPGYAQSTTTIDVSGPDQILVPMAP